MKRLPPKPVTGQEPSFGDEDALYAREFIMWIDEMKDKVLRAPDGELYGPLRPAGEGPEELAGRAFASDCCGNYFLLEEFGSVTFWNHETGEFIELANTWQDFLDWLIVPDRVEVRPGQVKRAWIDPEFSAKHGGTKKLQ